MFKAVLSGKVHESSEIIQPCVGQDLDWNWSFAVNKRRVPLHLTPQSWPQPQRRFKREKRVKLSFCRSEKKAWQLSFSSKEAPSKNIEKEFEFAGQEQTYTFKTTFSLKHKPGQNNTVSPWGWWIIRMEVPRFANALLQPAWTSSKYVCWKVLYKGKLLVPKAGSRRVAVLCSHDML